MGKKESVPTFMLKASDPRALKVVKNYLKICDDVDAHARATKAHAEFLQWGQEQQLDVQAVEGV